MVGWKIEIRIGGKGLKEYIHKLKQISMGTRIIENRTKYYALCIGCALVHLFFTISMFCANLKIIAIYNLFVVVYYCFMACVLTPLEKYYFIFFGSILEVELNSTLCTMMLGVECQFMLYTVALIPGAFYLANTWPGKNKQKVTSIPMITSVGISAMYVIVDVVQQRVPTYYPLTSTMRTTYHYCNIGIAIFLLMTFSILFELEVHHIQNMLNDENSRLGEIAAKDPLTKALNRRSMCSYMETELAGNQSPEFCVLMIDIDDFKSINDVYGHDTGDQVLIGVAGIMHEITRESDYVCRWGGEEFLLMIHGTISDAYEAAERIRSTVAAKTFSRKDTQFHVTLTIGLAEYQLGLKIRTLVDTADQKLYYGKKHGKNQVVK